jgi:hypothetical protein
MLTAVPGAAESARHERAIGALCESEEVPLAVVQRLFAKELVRLEIDARVHRYLSVLATRNVRAVLRHEAASSSIKINRLQGV